MKIISTTKKNQWYSSEINSMIVDSFIETTLECIGESTEEWVGFGGCFNELSKIALNELRIDEQDKLMDQFFNPEGDGLRFNFCRLPIGASDYAVNWYSYNETDGDYDMNHFSIKRDYEYLIPYVKMALEKNKDICFFASPWSPPTWMKTSKVYNHGTLVQTDENLRAYAKYLCKYVEAYQKEGISIRQLHVQNEPVSDQKFPSCVWTGEEFKRFIGQYLGPMIEKERLDVKIWLGTLNGPETDERAPYTRYNDYANLVLHDQDAYSYIEGISYQWAGKYAVQVTKQAFPEKKMIQSENECGDGKNTWEYANYVFELLHHYITNGVNAYVYWNMILMPEGRSTWGWKQNSLVTINEHEIVYNYEYYVMKHFSRYIKKGAKRLELRGHISGNSVGFKNSDGTRVYVIQNPFKKALKVTLGSEVIYLPAESINTVLL